MGSAIERKNISEGTLSDVKDYIYIIYEHNWWLTYVLAKKLK